MTDVYVAKKNAYVTLDGADVRLKKGVSRIAADHPLVKAHPDLFEPAGTDTRFDVRDTTARPKKQAASSSTTKETGKPDSKPQKQAAAKETGKPDSGKPTAEK